MTIHRNHCVEKSLVSVSHLCRRLYKNNQNGVCRFFCKEKKKTKKKLLCVQKERKVTPNKSLYFHYIYIYECCWLREDGVPLFFLSLWLVMFQCSSASGAVLERVRVLTQQVVAESVVGNRTSTGSHVRSLSSVLCLLNSTFFFFFRLIIQLNQLYIVKINLNFNCFVF
jgi:hypothetical protein